MPDSPVPLQEGMDEYIAKPVRKAPLLDIVRQTMRSGDATDRVSS